MDDDKKRELFLHQKETLDKFLSTGAISQAQYDKSYGIVSHHSAISNISRSLTKVS